MHGDIGDADVVRAALAGGDAVVNFAAETHVDRSISEPGRTSSAPTCSARTRCSRRCASSGVGRYLQISTDEVYGSIDEGSFTEESPLDPSSPYSASKAGGDLLVLAYHRTFGTAASSSRAARTTTGPSSTPRSSIPLFISNALDGEPLPVYGDGLQVRDWLYVEDNCAAIDLVLREGEPGQRLQRRRRERGRRTST